MSGNICPGINVHVKDDRLDYGALKKVFRKKTQLN